MNSFFKVIFSLICLFPILLSAQKSEYFDGPYVFHQNDSLRVQWVEGGVGHDTLIAKSEAGVFQREFLPTVDLRDLDFETNESAVFTGAQKIIALSDVHGQYDLMLKLLKATGVIDVENHWQLGNGHLVIVGDNLDRGSKHTEVLWFLFYLQKEARKAGGKVHVLLGNHEVMVMNGDLRYIHKKYRYTAGVFNTLYRDFFREGSVLGDWLASRPVIISVNERLFVHGGVSPSILELRYSLDKINETFRGQLIRRNEDIIFQDQKLALLYAENGPLWYRGYFNIDSTFIDMKGVNRILRRFKQKNIIVGHTSMESIKPLFEGKVIGIDCSIKLGKTGQVLIFENDKFFIGELSGDRNPIAQTEQDLPEKKKGLFDYVYEMEGRPHLKIETDIKCLIKKKGREEYQKAQFTLSDNSGETLLNLKGKLRARGNIRKKVCMLPPVKIDFPKKKLDSLGFIKHDKLKLVFPCSYAASNQEKLFKEYFLYELYKLIEPSGIRAKLIDIHLTDAEKDEKMTGILVEDEVAYANWNNANVIEKGKIAASHFDRESFVKMQFFQYMIANTDWSLENKHNLEIVNLNSPPKILALPYDFDYSGFVGQSYAVPHPSLPIKDVHERYFFSYKVSDEEFEKAVEFYRSVEEDVYRLCENAVYMSEKINKANKNYLRSFFKMLENPDRLKKSILR